MEVEVLIVRIIFSPDLLKAVCDKGEEVVENCSITDATL